MCHIQIHHTEYKYRVLCTILTDSLIFYTLSFFLISPLSFRIQTSGDSITRKTNLNTTKTSKHPYCFATTSETAGFISFLGAPTLWLIAAPDSL